MIETKLSTISQQIDSIYNQLKENESINVSLVQEVQHQDPLVFYQVNHLYKGYRWYWKNAEGSFKMTGIGHFKTIHASSTDERFQAVEQEINRFKSSIVQHEKQPSTGVGPVFFGGFSFFSSIAKSSSWEKFYPASFVLPEFLLTLDGDDCYLTFNANMNKETDINKLKQKVEDILPSQSKQTLSPMPKRNRIVDELTYKQWEGIVNHAVRNIQDGMLDKVVLARKIDVEFNHELPIEVILDALEKKQANSYVFSFEIGDDVFVGASPERLVQVNNRSLYSACLAGSIRRGSDSVEDDLLASELLHDEKNLQEHAYVVDTIRSSIEASCEKVHIPKEPVIRALQSIQHLYTPVYAELNERTTLFQIVEQLHPTPALGGEPKGSAMKFIKSQEPMERGWYAAPVGWIDSNGDGEFAVAIRSALIQHDTATLFAGCGIVEDSDPQSEYEETDLKLKTMLSALGGNL
ncbi:isochorismate synthase [Halalkalibacillus halophilus]|uniref:isochorismate synthase n=1 Tax=Halalkalibacillus halophilus TaxID=392827 RepID=UPI000415CC0A|nr:isochorismate synthase [Halalkalibacillus halophilus]